MRLKEIVQNQTSIFLSAWFMTGDAAPVYLPSETIPTQLGYPHFYRIFLQSVFIHTRDQWSFPNAVIMFSDVSQFLRC